MSSTPMMQQYSELKTKYKDCLLFFRLGDFYEMFGDDAIISSKILNIALTSRLKNEKKVPMCGIPYHAVNNYLSRLTKAGYKVAICEQLSDPNLPGIVDRDVIKIVSPGATFDENILDSKSNNYLLAISPGKGVFGFAYADLTTGEFKVTEITNLIDLKNEIHRLNPSECLIAPENKEAPFLQELTQTFKSLFVNFFLTYEDGYQGLLSHFQVQNLEGFDLEKLESGRVAAGLLLSYLKETQKNHLSHFTKITRYSLDKYMYLDSATLRNLELIINNRTGGKDYTLLSILDQTLTPMGGRLLRRFIVQPLVELDQINYRLNGVDELFQNQLLLLDLETSLKKILDIERLLGRLATGSGNARDLVALKFSLAKIPDLKNLLKNTTSAILQTIFQNLDEFQDLVALLDRAVVESPPLSIREGGFIKEGFSPELDELKKISRDGKNYLNEIQVREIKRTGINSLKVRFNKVFGYYLEISKANLKNVPTDYIRKQTLVNAERFITPELKEYEDKVLGAEEKIQELEYQLFIQLKDQILSEITRLQKTAATIALLDVISTFSRVALANKYTKPEVNNEDIIKIIAGRHPVIEKSTFTGEFVANDLLLDHDTRQLILLTGPNMAGKSTYLRQIALITLLAQIGSFVPAAEAKISLVDRIFTRVGASDNLSQGQSTFMVEMQEAANILHYATAKSLIIIDEIGRGTSTYDGVSIAWAIVEYLHDELKAKTVFATHYHELISLAEKLDHAKNYCVTVKENKEEGVVFLHKVIPGGIDKSYGIEVARLAGLPLTVTKKAREILNNLENNLIAKYHQSRLHLPPKPPTTDETQLPLFKENPVLESLKNIDLNNLTPLQALEKLDEIKKKI